MKYLISNKSLFIYEPWLVDFPFILKIDKGFLSSKKKNLVLYLVFWREMYA